MSTPSDPTIPSDLAISGASPAPTAPPPPASSGPSLAPPTRRKELVILITVGWALYSVFVLTVLAGLFPLQIRNLAWSQNVSRLIVDAGSLALVGLALVRYGSYLRSLDLPARQVLVESLRSSRPRSSSTGVEASQSSGNVLARLAAKLLKSILRKPGPEPPRDPFALDQVVKDKLAMERNKLWVRRLAIAGTLGMLLLVPLQLVIFQRGATNLDRQFTQANLQQRQRFQQLEAALRDAPADRLRQGWLQFKGLDQATPQAGLPAPASQLDDLLAEAESNRQTAQQTLNQQLSRSRFALGRDSLRLLLGSLLYGWAFWAFVRSA